MRKKDTHETMAATVAVIFDTLAVFGGFMLAIWFRFDIGWIPTFFGAPENPYSTYCKSGLAGTLIFLIVFRSLGLYERPQLGRFESKIPRLVRAIGTGLVVSIVISSLLQNVYNVKISAITFLFSLFTITFSVGLERYLLFRLELHYAKYSAAIHRVIILGTDEVAAHLRRAIVSDPKLRSKVVGFLRTDVEEADQEIDSDMILGTVEELAKCTENGESVDQLILTNSLLGHKRIVDIIMFCEKNLITFNMVPDLFYILTGSMDVQSLDDIPLLGVSKWPLDLFWNRLLKRVEDILGASLMLIVSAPVLIWAVIQIRKGSPGPIFYGQERCGEQGRVFTLYKLRTMQENAEMETGPVFTSENDPRRTAVGGMLRRYNIDELPQLWNVIKGEMSLVGPRPERPHFVEKFKEDIGRYMWRHVSKPGLTGWAQVNGLRGNTSIDERIKYDLYYLENWSLALDFKVLVKTIFAHENAY